MKFLIKLFFVLTINVLAVVNVAANVASDSLPYREIPNLPEKYTPETVVARMIDGLGFRYYWATEGLRPQDLSFKPGDQARTSQETIDHILELSTILLHAVDKSNNLVGDVSTPTFDIKRRTTLENLKRVSDILKSGKTKLEDCIVTVNDGERKTTFPFWLQINGPIEDAVWHVGQIVSFRRSSGNPFNPKANVLMGKIDR